SARVRMRWKVWLMAGRIYRCGRSERVQMQWPGCWAGPLPVAVGRSTPHQRAVLDALRHDVAAQALLAVLLVIAETALEPVDLAVALEGEDVGADAVHEPAVVADDHGTSAVVLDGLL